MHYLLFYEKSADHTIKEAPLHAAHLLYLDQAVMRGDLLLGGNLDAPPEGRAALLFRAESPASVEAFAAADPYVTGGVVERWHICAWETVVGAALAPPDREVNQQPE